MAEVELSNDPLHSTQQTLQEAAPLLVAVTTQQHQHPTSLLYGT